VQEAGILAGLEGVQIKPETHGRQVLHVGPEPGEEAAEDGQGGTGEDDEQEQNQRQHHVDLRQALHAGVQARHHRYQRCPGDDGDQDHLGGVGGGDIEQIVETGGGLLGAEAERRGQPEQGGQHRQRVDDMPGPAPHPVTEQGMKGRAQGQRQAPVEGEKGQREAHHRVDGPGVQTPVENRPGHAHLGRRRHVGLDDLAGLGVEGRLHPQRRGEHVVHRLQHPEEHQADAHTGGEQHGEPAGIAEIRGGLRAAEANTAEGAHHQNQAEQHEEVRRTHQQPVEGGGGRRAQPAEELGGLGLEHQRQRHEHDDQAGGDDEHGVVDIQADHLDVVLADLVVGDFQFLGYIGCVCGG